MNYTDFRNYQTIKSIISTLEMLKELGVSTAYVSSTFEDMINHTDSGKVFLTLNGYTAEELLEAKANYNNLEGAILDGEINAEDVILS